MRISDWSSDVCSSDLLELLVDAGHHGVELLLAELRIGQQQIELRIAEAELSGAQELLLGGAGIAQLQMNPAEQEAGLGIVGIALQSIFQLDPGSRQVALLEKLLRALETAGGVNGGRGPKRKPCQRQKGKHTGQRKSGGAGKRVTDRVAIGGI